MSALLPDGTTLLSELPNWLRLAIADAVVIFGRIEQRIIEIFWTVEDSSDPKQRERRTRNSATVNFEEVIESIEKSKPGAEFPDLKSGFKRLAGERNLIVHGSWLMRDDLPCVVWHKFECAKDEVPAEAFPKRRFVLFMALADHLFEILRQLLILFEKQASEMAMQERK